MCVHCVFIVMMVPVIKIIQTNKSVCKILHAFFPFNDDELTIGWFRFHQQSENNTIIYIYIFFLHRLCFFSLSLQQLRAVETWCLRLF